VVLSYRAHVLEKLAEGLGKRANGFEKLVLAFVKLAKRANGFEKLVLAFAKLAKSFGKRANGFEESATALAKGAPPLDELAVLVTYEPRPCGRTRTPSPGLPRPCSARTTGAQQPTHSRSVSQC
jgi:hypothetical protein